jgi:hypothetical protein
VRSSSIYRTLISRKLQEQANNHSTEMSSFFWEMLKYPPTATNKRIMMPKDVMLSQYGSILGQQYFQSFQKEIDAFAFKVKKGKAILVICRGGS